MRKNSIILIGMIITPFSLALSARQTQGQDMKESVTAQFTVRAERQLGDAGGSGFVGVEFDRRGGRMEMVHHEATKSTKRFV